MDKPTYPPSNFSALDDVPLTGPRTSSDPQFERAAARWEEPSSKRKFIPAIVIGVAVAGLAVGMDYKFRHDKKEPATPTLAQGPAVESMVNEAPPAAGSTDTATAPAAEQAATVAPTTSTPADTTSTPAAAPPPPPAPAPRAERAAPRAVTPAPRPVVPDPEPTQRSEAVEAPAPQAPPATTPAPVPEAPAPAQQAIQPPSPMPVPQPAPEAPGTEPPSGS